MQKVYGILLLIMLICIGCQWHLTPSDADEDASRLAIQRYDRIESLYLTTGDISALQQINTSYPIQTRLLLEDVLRLGKVDDEDINTKFYYFFQDSTLQQMLADVTQQYTEMEDIEEELASSFKRLREELPALEYPEIYAQIGSFDQSIIVGAGTLGISLDKYLGEDYPFYQEHYSEAQRRMMTRSMIVPDCLAFYILSQYPLSSERRHNQQERDRHMGRIHWTVNQLMGRSVFDNEMTKEVDEYISQHPSTTINQLLLSD